MTITIGFWFIPLIITILSFWITARIVRLNMFVMTALFYVPATLLSLFVWLIYFIIF